MISQRTAFAIVSPILLIFGYVFTTYAWKVWGPPMPPTAVAPPADQPSFARMSTFAFDKSTEDSVIRTRCGDKLMFHGTMLTSRSHWWEPSRKKAKTRAATAKTKNALPLSLKPLIYRWSSSGESCVAQGEVTTTWIDDEHLAVEGSIVVPTKAGKYEFRMVLDEGNPMPGKPRYSLVRTHVAVK